MTLKDKLKNSIIVFDGATGTQLQTAGLPAGVAPEEWNLTRPDCVERVHREYLDAGADIILTNTFGVNSLKYGEKCGQLTRAAVRIAKRAAGAYRDRFVAIDIGPTGKLLKPLGNLGFEQAVSAFKATIKAAAEEGADLVFIETMNDIYETKAAVLAAKETCDLPVFACCVYGSDEKTMTGCSPEAEVAVLEGLGVAALGINCSLAPRQMLPVVRRMAAVSSTPIIVKPNAGLPSVVNGKTVYDLDADGFTSDMLEAVKLGARCVGGCCGTSPEYIKKLSAAVKQLKPAEITPKNLTVISSYTNALYFGDIPVIIGERINPTGKKRLKQALKEGDTAYILNEAVAQAEAGAHALDVNVGMPEIDEAEELPRLVAEIQSVTDLPLQIDCSDPQAIGLAMRVYNGKPLVNSVNGKEESMRAIFPLVKKYGGAVIALTLDERGIPATAEGRIEIARKILKTAGEYGLSGRDIIFDTLAMAVSADGGAAEAALKSLSYIRNTLGVNTSLGVSNISFGLPERAWINSTFFAMAMTCGLSAAIINPLSREMMKTYHSYLALSGRDKSCLEYISFCSDNPDEKTAPELGSADLKRCILKGLKVEAASGAARLLKESEPLAVINNYIVPALDEAGRQFEQKKLYLPQLLMCAEAASAAFEVIKSSFGGAAGGKKLKIALATVRGDIHDIGKNIVKTLLENYGFTVVDLGRDVPPESVVEAVRVHGIKLVGLSALMTTTVASMRETIVLLRESCPDCKIIVGGAVLTEEFSRELGADAYGRDAMATVRYAEGLEKNL